MEKIYEEIKQIKDMVSQLITIVGATNTRLEGVEEELQGVKKEVQEVKEELKTKASTVDLANLANGIDEKFDELNEKLHQQNEFFLEKFAKHEQEIFMLKKRLVG